jgi:hypothetical protein
MIRQFNWIKKMSLLAAFSVVAGNVCAAECKQGSARYVDPESGLLLSFSSFGENVQVMHQFTIGLEGADTQLGGFVVVEGEPLRPISIVMNKCPDGDVTGEELEACTVWKGVPYGRFSDGNIGLLPLADEVAVTQILLPDFTRSVMSDPVWEEIETINDPFEVFDFKDCGVS